jgi:hypothetical protein
MVPASSDTDLWRRMMAVLEGGYDLPADLRGLLYSEMKRYEAGEVDDVSLPRIFGLVGPGKRLLSTLIAQRQTDLHLSAAYDCTAGLNNFTARETTRYKFMAAQIPKLIRTWPRLPQVSAPWEGEMFKYLAEIKKIEQAGGPKLPRTWEGIRAALRRRR